MTIRTFLAGMKAIITVILIIISIAAIDTIEDIEDICYVLEADWKQE